MLEIVHAKSDLFFLPFLFLVDNILVDSSFSENVVMLIHGGNKMKLKNICSGLLI